MFDRVVGMVLQLAQVPILAAHWGLERYGLWGMLIAVPGILLLSDLGFATAATVRMTMQIARGERDAARTTMHSATQVVLGACAVILILAGAAVSLVPDAALPRFAATGAAELRTAVVCLAAYAALIISNGLILAVFRSNHRFAWGSLLSTFTLLLENGLLVAVVARGHGIGEAALALLCGRALGSALALVAAARLRTGVLPGLRQADPAVRTELVGPALAAMAIPLGLTLTLQGQVVALGMAASSAAIPAFVAARTLSRIGLQLAQALAHPLIPEFGAASAQDNKRGVERMFTLVIATAVIISASFAALLALAGPWIVKTWSAGHITASPEMMWTIALSALCGGIWNPVSNLILAINRQASFAPLLVILAALGIVATLALGAMLGSIAAALAMAAIDLVMLIVVLRFALAHWAAPQDLDRTARALAQEAVGHARRLLGHG